MMNLIVSTLPKDDLDVMQMMSQLNLKDTTIVYTEDMNIKGCIGCNHCWLVTPGVCTIKDDYEKLLIQFLQAQKVMFITELHLGFVSYQMKNIIDRLLPLATMNLHFENGQMRHYLRYKKHYQMGFIYNGEGNQEFLERWFKRVMLNFEGTSLGVYSMNNKEMMKNALIND